MSPSPISWPTCAPPTPSAAAELVVATTLEEVIERIARARAKSLQAVRYRFAMHERRLRRQGIDRTLGLLHRQIGRHLQRIDEFDYRLRDRIRAATVSRERVRRALETRLLRFDLRPRLAADRRRMEAAHSAAVQLARTRLLQRRARLDQLTAKLGQLSPLRILDRGYAIVSNRNGIVTDPAQAPPESAIHVRVAKGTLDAVVKAN